MDRTEYRGYVIDSDDLGRPYIYNTESPYSEDSDHILVHACSVQECKEIIDARIQHNADIRSYSEVGA